MTADVRKLNDAPVLDQLDGYWAKLAALLLSKLVPPGEEVVITAQDIKQLEADWPGGAIVMVHGRHDAFALKLVTAAAAQRLAAYERTQRGTT